MLANSRTDRLKRPREIGDHLDHHEQRQHDERHALGHEEFEEFDAVLPEAEQRDAEEDEGGEREGDDDVAGHGEGIGHHAEHVQRQHEHEEREHEAGNISCPSVPTLSRTMLAMNS